MSLCPYPVLEIKKKARKELTWDEELPPMITQQCSYVAATIILWESRGQKDARMTLKEETECLSINFYGLRPVLKRRVRLHPTPLDWTGLSCRQWLWELIQKSVDFWHKTWMYEHFPPVLAGPGKLVTYLSGNTGNPLILNNTTMDSPSPESKS